jgi:NADPH:quinone reductase-like Zn-dependent oxidoreductase
VKAVIYEEYGDSEVLRLAEVEDPHAGPGQVRVKTVALGLNPIDFKIRRGWLQGMFPQNFPAIPGGEIAGIVDEVGEGVTGVSVGDEVMGFTVTGVSGAFAQYALALAGDVAPKPAGLDWDLAAAVPVAIETADRVLELLKVTAGETLLLLGASGVVGSVGVQLAVARGVTVIGTGSEANHDYLRSLGAIPVAYGDGLADRVRAAAPQGIDAVFDAGYDDLAIAIELRGGTTDRIVNVTGIRAAELGVTFSSGPRHQFAPTLAEYAQRVADGQLSVRIEQSLLLADAAQAQDISETGHPRGKLVLRP